MPDVTIFHNPACGTSRNVLAIKLLPVGPLPPFDKEDGEVVHDDGVRLGA